MAPNFPFLTLPRQSFTLPPFGTRNRGGHRTDNSRRFSLQCFVDGQSSAFPKLALPKLSTSDQGLPATLPLLKLDSSSRDWSKQASAVHTGDCSSNIGKVRLCRYDYVSQPTSRIAPINPCNVTGGKLGTLDVRHKQLN